MRFLYQMMILWIEIGRKYLQYLYSLFLNPDKIIYILFKLNSCT